MIKSLFAAEYIESDKFFVTAHGMELEWQLCLYPSGKDCEDEEHVSILLELVSRSVGTNNCIGSFIYCCFSINHGIYVIRCHLFITCVEYLTMHLKCLLFIKRQK